MASTYIELAPSAQATIVGEVEVANDSGNPVPVNAIDLDIRDLSFATDSIDVSGSNINISATDLDIRDLSFATDSVDISGSEVSLDAATLAALENITVTSITNPVTVQATNLDIRDLTSVSDSVSAVQSGTWNINNISGTVSLPTGAATSANQTTIIGHVDGIEALLSGTLTVQATNLDTRDLTSTSDSVTNVPQKTTAGTPASVTVSTTAVLLAASNANRRSIIITNNSTGDLFIGHSSAVTSSGAAMGLIVPPKSSYSDSGDGMYTGDLYGIYSAVAASQNISVSERT